MKEWKEVSSRLMWVRKTLVCEIWAFFAAYGLESEIREDVRDEFWEELRVCFSGFRTDESAILLGDQNERVCEVEIEGVTVNFRVPGVNESGERLIRMCSDARLLIGSI